MIKFLMGQRRLHVCVIINSHVSLLDSGHGEHLCVMKTHCSYINTLIQTSLSYNIYKQTQRHGKCMFIRYSKFDFIQFYIEDIMTFHPWIKFPEPQVHKNLRDY